MLEQSILYKLQCLNMIDHDLPPQELHRKHTSDRGQKHIRSESMILYIVTTLLCSTERESVKEEIGLEQEQYGHSSKQDWSKTGQQ